MTLSQLINAVQNKVYSIFEWLKFSRQHKTGKGTTNASRREATTPDKEFRSPATKEQFLSFLQNLFGYPNFLNEVLYQRFISNNTPVATITSLAEIQDPGKRLFYALKTPSSNTINIDDLTSLIEEITLSHTGLAFLKETPEVLSKYVETVCSRILYSVNRSKTGRITLSEFTKSKLPQTLLKLESTDINTAEDFFSYIEFFVILTKFQELDLNEDQLLEKADLLRYSNRSLSKRIVKRIFKNMSLRSKLTASKNTSEHMTYKEFIWFILSEEDKMSQTSVEYWFECLDLDGDGYLSVSDLEYFYEEQVSRMSALGIEIISKNDFLEEIFHMLNPVAVDRISLADIKKSKLSRTFYNMMFNLSKFLSSECLPSSDVKDLSDWKIYTEYEYEMTRRSIEGNEGQIYY